MEPYKIMIYGTLFINALIIIDSFLLPPVERHEVYNMRSDVITSGSGYRMRGRSYTTEYLVTTSGHHYELPDHSYIKRSEGDSVTMGISALFRRPYRVRWTEAGQRQSVDIRPYTHGLAYPLALWSTTLVSLLLLVFPSIVPAEPRETLALFCAFFTVMPFVFYFW